MEFHRGTTCCGSKTLCGPSVELEIIPAKTEVYFLDERFVDPVNTQIRFSYILHQSRRGSVAWRVLDKLGQPGKGTIDDTGLYKAPQKGTLVSGTTEYVVASIKGFPFIQARAAVTIVGEGPEPEPVPEVTIFPKTVNLYHSTPRYMDSSNSRQIFRADVFKTNQSGIIWKKNFTTISGAGNGLHYQYTVSDYDPVGVPIHISAHLQIDPTIYATAVITPVAYHWPALL